MGIRRVDWKEARDNIRRAARENPSVSYLSTVVNHEDGYCQLWAYGDCHFVTRVDVNKDGRRLVVCLLGGENLFDWGYQLEKELSSLAKAYQCAKIAIEGRKGWEKLLKPLGFKQEVVTLVKELTDRIRFNVTKNVTSYGIPMRWREI
jgi:hypothetical protein